MLCLGKCKLLKVTASRRTFHSILIPVFLFYCRRFVPLLFKCFDRVELPVKFFIEFFIKALRLAIMRWVGVEGDKRDGVGYFRLEINLSRQNDRGQGLYTLHNPFSTSNGIDCFASMNI